MANRLNEGKQLTSIFIASLAGNAALIILGYEAVTVKTLPHWVIVGTAFVAAVLLALLNCRIVGRAYAREDRAYATLQQVFGEFDGNSRQR